MTRIILILLGCAVMIGVARTAYVDARSVDGAYLACADDRVVTYGATNETVAIAELAAIARWMEQSEEVGDAYGNWALARDRWLQCRRIGKTENMQCKASGLPCRPKPAPDADAFTGADSANSGHQARLP